MTQKTGNTETVSEETSREGRMNYHYPSHPTAYPTGYLSHSLWVKINGEELLLIQEMDAESGGQQRHAFFTEHQGGEICVGFQPRNIITGQYRNRVQIFGVAK